MGHSLDVIVTHNIATVQTSSFTVSGISFITQCEERLIQEKVIMEPFTVTQIQGGILKEYLIEEDYLAPQKVKLTNL